MRIPRDYSRLSSRSRYHQVTYQITNGVRNQLTYQVRNQIMNLLSHTSSNNLSSHESSHSVSRSVRIGCAGIVCPGVDCPGIQQYTAGINTNPRCHRGPNKYTSTPRDLIESENDAYTYHEHCSHRCRAVSPRASITILLSSISGFQCHIHTPPFNRSSHREVAEAWTSIRRSSALRVLVTDSCEGTAMSDNVRYHVPGSVLPRLGLTLTHQILHRHHSLLEIDHSVVPYTHHAQSYALTHRKTYLQSLSCSIP